MNNDRFAKLKEVLASSENPEKALKIYKDSGVVSSEEAEGLEEEIGLAEKHYDLEELRKAILSGIAADQLSNLEIKEGQYQFVVDHIANEDSIAEAMESLGLENMDLDEEMEDLDQEDLFEVIEEYCEKLAEDLNKKINLPGSLNFVWSDDSFDLVFNFEESQVKELEQLGAGFGKVESNYSLTEIVAALEETGMHDAARRLHLILRGGQ